MNLDKFIKDFGGVTESYWFYDHTVELRYDPKKHVYMLVNGLDLEVQEGVTNVCHIVDKSEMLIPWGCKMMSQKLLKTVPVEVDGGVEVIGKPDSHGIMPISLEEFTKLVMAAKSAHKDKLEDAGNVGSMAHNWIEQFIKKMLGEREALPDPVTDERAERCYNAALDWMQAHRVKFVCTERKIYSRKHKYAGTLDGLAYVSSCDDPNCCPHAFDDRLSIIDWKTSNFIQPEYGMQTASYRAAYSEEFGSPIQDCWIIRLGKEDGKFETWHIEAEDCDENFRMFLVCLDLTRSMRGLKARMNEKTERLKAAAKADKQAAKELAQKLRCKSADKYKGTRKPTCNGGVGCKACWAKYAEVQALKDLKKEAELLGFEMPEEDI